jgi:arsenite oxidase small subunit
MTSTERDEETKEEQKAGPSARETGRRRFLKVGLTAGLVLVVVGIAGVARSLISPPNPPQAQEAAAPQTTTVTVTVGGSGGNSTAGASTASTSTSSSPFPRLMVANLSDVSTTTPVYFNYPLQEAPNILVKLGVAAPGGVGPDNDIVAFSQICQHLGCIYGFVPEGGAPACDSSYKAPGPEGYCCCHGSIYDLAKAGAVVGGPAPRPVPQVTLEFDSSSGNIYAVGMGPPTIFGHDTGSSDVLNDLQGGTLVS